MQTELQFKKSLMSILLASTIAVAPVAMFAQANPDKHEQEVSPIAEQDVSDHWKAGLVEGAYLFNTNLNNFKIDVDVVGNTATLDGEVDTDIEKSLAQEIALSIDGIDKVNNHLVLESDKDADKDEVKAAQTDEAKVKENSVDSKSFKETLTDAAITTKVKSRLIANPEASGLDINVDTENGSVTLQGEVDSKTEKELAFYIAHNTSGVVSVENRIMVREGEEKSTALN